MKELICPEADAYRGGCKVSWYGYRRKVDAEKASKYARHWAIIRSNQGYDFGWLWPGDISKKGEDGLYWVTMP